jgi:Probable Zinc-ribbon domain/Protein of unknown function (DUF559)
MATSAGWTDAPGPTWADKEAVAGNDGRRCRLAGPAGRCHRWGTQLMTGDDVAPKVSPMVRSVSACHDQDGTCELHKGPPRRTRPGPSLADACPDVAALLDVERSGFDASEVTVGSSTALAVWQCSTGNHTWCAPPNSLTNARGGTGCGVCAGKAVIASTSLAAAAPDLAAQWDMEANNGLGPDEVSPNANRRYWWVCPVASDHRWRASPNNRYGKGSGCRACSGKQASSTNNLTLAPLLMAEWAHEANRLAGVDPTQVTLSSSQEVIWMCVVCGQRWPDSPSHRAAGRGCPYCSGHRVSELNSLQARAPKLAAEFDIERNCTTPETVSIGSNNDNIWWKCSIEPHLHRWQASPNNRWNGTGCPECRLTWRSEQEIRLSYELAEVLGFNPQAHRLMLPDGRHVDVDILCEHRRLAIEFDGSHWHADTAERDLAKSAAIGQAGWTIVRVRESPLVLLGEHDVVVPFNGSAHEVAAVVLHHLQALGFVEDTEVAAYRSAGRALAAAAAESALGQLRRLSQERAVVGR